MKGPIGLFPRLDICRLIAGPNSILGLPEDGLRQMRSGMAESKTLKLRPHLGHLPDFIQVEESNANPPPRLADHQTLGLEPAKGLTNRHVARAELPGDVILP